MTEFSIILFKSTHSTDAEDWEDMLKKDLETERKDFLKACKRLVKKLEGVDSDAYVEEYTKGINKLFKYSSLPIKHFAPLNITQDSQDGSYTFEVCETDDLWTRLQEVSQNLQLKEVCYFDNVDFIYSFFKKYLAGNACWLTDAIIDEGIEACTQVIADNLKAPELLPTEEQVYDKPYISEVREFRKALKHAKKVMEKKYAVYAVYVPKKDFVETLVKNQDETNELS